MCSLIRVHPEFANGHTKSKWFFQADVSSNNRTNEFDSTTMIPQVYLFLFVFWKKFKTPKRHFEINWPLVTGNFIHWKLLSMAQTRQTLRSSKHRHNSKFCLEEAPKCSKDFLSVKTIWYSLHGSPLFYGFYIEKSQKKITLWTLIIFLHKLNSWFLAISTYLGAKILESTKNFNKSGKVHMP